MVNDRRYKYAELNNGEEIPEPETYYMHEDTVFDKETVSGLVNRHKAQQLRAELLLDYYKGFAPIQLRIRDRYKPNNHLIAPYPSYITDVLTGMFIGNPITYSVPEGLEDDFEKIQEVFDYNDEQDESFEIAKLSSIMGKAYEIIYTERDRKGDLRLKFNELSLKDTVFIYDTKINPEPLAALYIQGEGASKRITVFHRDYIEVFEGEELEQVERKPNLIGKVQIIENKNNNEGIGDFERVISLINAYNKALSDTANDFEEFTNAILVLRGMQRTNPEDVARLMEDRILLLDAINGSVGGNQDAHWLTKKIDNEASEAHKTRIDEDIHRFTKVPNLIDEKFSGNSSGVALEYKLLALDQVISMKERKFKRFIQDRLEIIIDFLRLTGENIQLKHYDIDIKFNPNTPINEWENVKMVKELLSIVSEKTALERLHFIDNVNEELDNKERELYGQAQIYSDFIKGEGLYNDDIQYQNVDPEVLDQVDSGANKPGEVVVDD